jgi:hypothetical protein
MRTPAVIALAWALFPSMSHALTPYADAFSGKALNSVRWQRALFKNAKLWPANGRLNFTIAPAFDPDEDYAYLELRNNRPGFAEDWQVTVDVTNTSGQGDRIGAGFWIFNAADSRDVAFFEFFGNPGATMKQAGKASFVLDGQTSPARLSFNSAKLTSAKLRVSFNKRTKLMTFSVGVTNPKPAGGTRLTWTPIGTFSPTGKGGTMRADWQMNPAGGSFGIRLEAYGEQRTLAPGKVSLDNFALAAPSAG